MRVSNWIFKINIKDGHKIDQAVEFQFFNLNNDV